MSTQILTAPDGGSKNASQCDCKATMQSLWRSNLFVLFHELHECLLVHKTGIVSILKDAEVTEAKFGEALVNKVDGRVHV